MPQITYIDSSNVEHSLDVKLGTSVMDGAVKNSVPGIDADCGGACSCATCHVYVDPSWENLTGERNEMEQSMLDFADNVQSNSRLSCQIKVTEELDGLIVRVAPRKPL